MPDAQTEKIVIAGAGTVGCYVGGHLIHHNRKVCLLARQNIADQIHSYGLHLTNLEGLNIQLPPDKIDAQTDASCLKNATIILVTVKSGATDELGKLIAQNAPQNATIISLQNGTTNVDILRASLPSHTVLAGMVPYNVVQMGNGHFHQGTSGHITLERHSDNFDTRLTSPTLPFAYHDNIQGVQWGKLLINLNNALNALSGIPLRQQFMSQQWRRLLADQMAEALPLLSLENIQPVSFTPLPPKLTPHILRMPNFLYRHFTSRMPKIDPKARSSMWEDLQAGRKTEISELQGHILKLAQKHARNAPLNAKVAALIRDAEASGKGSPCLKPEEVRI